MIVSGHGGTHTAHLGNSGRLRELIYPGSMCLCEPRARAKTTLRLLGVPVSERWAVLVDPREQTKCFEQALDDNLIPWLDGWRITGREIDCSESRIDYQVSSGECTGYIEVKSAAMLIHNNTGSFPDCPTIRGRKHVTTMRRLAGRHRSIILFLVQHPQAALFSPNREGDAVFADALSAARMDGVEIRAIKMCMSHDGSVDLIDPDLYCLV